MSPIRVGFDEQTYIFHRGGGIPRYFTELFRALQSDSSSMCKPSLEARFGISTCAIEAGLIRSTPGPERLARRLAYFMNTPTRDFARRADLLHRTYYHPRFVSRKVDSPTVYTIVDFIPETFPELFPGGNPHLAKDEAIRSASGLICISHHTRDVLLQRYPELAIPVCVTPLGVADFWFRNNGTHQTSPAIPYFLFVGRRDGYKDFSLVVKAFATSSLGDHELVVAGGGNPSATEIEFATRLGVSARIRWTNPSDAELRLLYRHATAFVFPSRLEGFGLPTLEAMAAGCTDVILADTPISREVGGAHANFFAPGSLEALGSALETSNSRTAEARQRYRNDAVAWARQFSWEDTAIRTAMAYQDILEAQR